MNTDGSQVRQLVDSPGLDDKPQWSPDGSRIGFATTRSGSPELMAVDPETGEERTLLSQPISGLNPAWSSDGSQLAFNVVTSQGFDIDVMSSDGENRRSVVTSGGSDERPRWSPDGEQLAYYSDAGGSWLHSAGRNRCNAWADRQPWIRRAAGMAADSALTARRGHGPARQSERSSIR